MVWVTLFLVSWNFLSMGLSFEDKEYFGAFLSIFFMFWLILSSVVNL